MSLATILMPPPRRRGRPRVADSTLERAKHVRCAAYRLLDGHSLEATAEHFEVSPRTVQLWTAQVLTYDDPAARALRRRLADRD